MQNKADKEVLGCYNQELCCLSKVTFFANTFKYLHVKIWFYMNGQISKGSRFEEQRGRKLYYLQDIDHNTLMSDNFISFKVTILFQ